MINGVAFQLFKTTQEDESSWRGFVVNLEVIHSIYVQVDMQKTFRSKVNRVKRGVSSVYTYRSTLYRNGGECVFQDLLKISNYLKGRGYFSRDTSSDIQRESTGIFIDREKTINRFFIASAEYDIQQFENKNIKLQEELKLNEKHIDELKLKINNHRP